VFQVFIQKTTGSKLAMDSSEQVHQFNTFTFSRRGP